ncbi:M23 family metallopeptidase [Pseudoalteromonas sp. SMS1]|uniref:M23 family metallopeptidase n=1 Tax=Pseudoalteromonas sp. SMS1 TaxID=2908894 RepID=UPI001F442C2D|nr:M23 family metallopeptidase [Pseudoalteromonas sp. SMS1]MCF2860469.1 M23 family metallopeptidase [Pseudoalteromonas sp. SMS1]
MERYLIFYAALIVVGVGCAPIKGTEPAKLTDKSSSNSAAANSFSRLSSSASLSQTPVAAVVSETVTIKAGESLISALKPYKVMPRNVLNLVAATRHWLDLNTIAAGTKLKLTLDENRQVMVVEIGLRFAKMLVAQRLGEQWLVSESSMQTQQIGRYAKVKIGDSLFNSALAADIPVKIINKLILVLSHCVDFQRALHKNDELEVFYHAAKLSKPNVLSPSLQAGPLLYINLTVAGKPYALYFHSDINNKGAYYFADGKPVQSFLLKTPIHGARLSSTFGQRKHPILGFTRIHKGLDFGAPLGTPVFAAGDGKVLKANWGGSFGNRILLQHQNGYRTLYAHLQGFAQNLKAGTLVKQGQVIGFLGNTGMSQARHLHYEVHKHGRAINPLNLDPDFTGHRKLNTQQLTQLSVSIAQINTRVSAARSTHFGSSQKMTLIE